MKNNLKGTRSRGSGIGLDALDSRGYQSSHMQKDQVITQLKKQGFRITKQRKILIDIILNEDCSCCKEVYVLAAKKDPGIGIATVYRTMDALEQAGALKRRSAYELCSENHKQQVNVELEDGSTLTLDYDDLREIVEHGMLSLGLIKEKNVSGIVFKQDESNVGG